MHTSVVSFEHTPKKKKKPCVEWWPGGGCCPATWFPGRTHDAGPIGICRPTQPTQPTQLRWQGQGAEAGAAIRRLNRSVGALYGQTKCSCADAAASEIAFPSAGCRIVWAAAPAARPGGTRRQRRRGGGGGGAGAWPNNTVIAIPPRPGLPNVSLCLVALNDTSTVPGTLTLSGRHAGECAYFAAPRQGGGGRGGGKPFVVTAGYVYATYHHEACPSITSQAACPTSRCWWNTTTGSCILPSPSPPPRYPKEPTPELLEKVARVFSARLSYGSGGAGAGGDGANTTTMGLTFGTPNTTADSYRPVVRWGTSKGDLGHMAACNSSAAGRACYSSSKFPPPCSPPTPRCHTPCLLGGDHTCIHWIALDKLMPWACANQSFNDC